MTSPSLYDDPNVLVDAQWLMEHLNDPTVRILDMRNPMHYMMGHIPGAGLVRYENMVRIKPGLPYMIMLAKEDVENLLANLGVTNQMTVVVYGDEEATTASKLFWTLDAYGVKARLLNVSFRTWATSGRPASRDPVQFVKTTFIASMDEKKQATAEYIVANLNNPDVKLIDTRTPEEYNGLVSAGLRAGRIPGSINIPHYECYSNDGTLFKPPQELKKTFHGRSLVPDKEVITYCMVGERAAYSYLALRLAGFSKVRLYDRSFSEWANTPSLPI